MSELIGHFHPVLVHLPIGFLMVALLLQWLSKKNKYSSLKQVLPLIFLIGTITALIACITGYFLSISAKYDRSLVNWHMWLAISVTLTSAILYTKEKNPAVEVPKKLLSIGLLGLLIATGHFGGALSHGANYLSKPFFKLINYDTAANVKPNPLK